MYDEFPEHPRLWVEQSDYEQLFFVQNVGIKILGDLQSLDHLAVHSLFQEVFLVSTKDSFCTRSLGGPLPLSFLCGFVSGECEE